MCVWRSPSSYLVAHFRRRLRAQELERQVRRAKERLDGEAVDGPRVVRRVGGAAKGMRRKAAGV